MGGHAPSRPAGGAVRGPTLREVASFTDRDSDAGAARLARERAVTERVRLVALGGLGEIGMNCMAIEHGDHRLLVDCGITFPEQPFGTDVIRPDFRYLLEERRAHQALWLTHGHEDHIGAVA